MDQNKRFKIWFFPRWYPDRSDNMFGLFVRRHAQAVSIFCDVTVLYITPSNICKVDYELIESNIDGVKEITCYYKNNRSYFAPLLNFWKFLIGTLKVYKYCRKKYGLPEINHVHVAVLVEVIIKISIIAATLRHGILKRTPGRPAEVVEICIDAARIAPI